MNSRKALLKTALNWSFQFALYGLLENFILANGSPSSGGFERTSSLLSIFTPPVSLNETYNLVKSIYGWLQVQKIKFNNLINLIN